MWIEKNLIINYIDECNDSFESFFTVYVLMDFCEETLEEIIKEIKNDENLIENGMLASLGYYIASEIFIEIFGAVKRLHEKVPQIIHRDLKPSNVLLTNGIKAKLVRIADFGLSTIHEFEDQTHTLDVGTCKYMAPEVINMKNYDSKADIYALGICLIEIFAIDINR
jgi:serine/threonine protein kinase